MTDETDKRSRAVALRYSPGDDPAPRVVAKGQGVVADRIMEIAKEHDVPIHRDADLVEVLAVLELGNLIPEEIYGAVAEVLAFLYKINRRAQAGLAS